MLLIWHAEESLKQGFKLTYFHLYLVFRGGRNSLNSPVVFPPLWSFACISIAVVGNCMSKEGYRVSQYPFWKDLKKCSLLIIAFSWKDDKSLTIVLSGWEHRVAINLPQQSDSVSQLYSKIISKSSSPISFSSFIVFSMSAHTPILQPSEYSWW